MALYALTMNPKKSSPEDLAWAEEAADLTAEGFSAESRWSVGSRKQGIRPGDRAFMLRQEVDRGLVGFGTFVSGIEPDIHWSDPNRTANYAYVEWHMFLQPSDRLRIETLKKDLPSINWDFGFQASGNEIPAASAAKVVARWERHLRGLGLSAGDQPEEVPQSFREGDRTEVVVNRYERNPRARSECLRLKGYRCRGCELQMDEVYGNLGKDFIHVHHITDLASVGEGYEVDPEHDMVPLCPNCHAMIHRGTATARPVAELRRIIASARKRHGV